jgi:nucleotidyltransferase substrate binding protein (TIGR01987 family)
MEKSLKTKYENTIKALDSLNVAIEQYQDVQEEPNVKLSQFSHADLVTGLRDSVIKRFEFTIDIFWKYLKAYLKEKHSVTPDVPSPRSFFREAGNIELIEMEDVSVLLKALDMRNLSSHIYHEEDAQKIADTVPRYYRLMNRVMQNLTP